MSSSEKESYNVQIFPSAQRELEELPSGDAVRISQAILRLAGNPRPPQSTKLVGYPKEYRLRVGWYRILYTVTDATSTVLVYRIGHRKDVYR